MTIKYPESLDSDQELPRVSDGVSEVSVEVLNALREAIFAIERTIGANPQGTLGSLVERISVFFNEDGTAKASALVAAGLVALPIGNSQIASNAAIAESKLDLDVATQDLQNALSSAEIDIAALSVSLSNLLNKYNNHVGGNADKHDGYDILLDSSSPNTTPGWLIGLTATSVSQALLAMNNRYLAHVSDFAVGAHPASAVSVDSSGMQVINANNVQTAIEQLDSARAVELISHRDDMHANGISFWANSSDGYNVNNQLLPATGSATISLVGGTNNIIDVSPLVLSSYPVKQGDMLVVFGSGGGIYTINDVGPRSSLGARPSLSTTQLEIVETFPASGTFTGAIYGASSVSVLKGVLASTIHQSDVFVDSVQVSRPGAARVVSLGIKPSFITSAHTLDLEVAVSATDVRTVSITDLHKNRSGTVMNPPTLDSIVERINYVFQNKVDGLAFPMAAYRVGDELMLAHNWVDSWAHIRVLSTGDNLFLGFDSAGANVADLYVYHTSNTLFYVNGNRLSDVASVYSGAASVSGSYVSFSGFDPEAGGVKIGNLVHVKSHSTLNENGTYFITEVNASNIKVHTVAGFTADTEVSVEICSDALALDEFNTTAEDLVLEVFVDSAGRLGYNQRLRYQDTITNMHIVEVSDSFKAASLSLVSSITGGVATLGFSGTYQKTVKIPTTFSGKLKIPSANQIEWIIADILAPVGTGTSAVVVDSHVNEEEVLELCSVRLDGLLTLSNIVDKRMFGTLGLDELREDVVRDYIELPGKELRSNGVVEGFEVLNKVYQDPSFPVSPVFYGVLFRGGVAYVDGVRVEVPTLPVMLPNVAATYVIGVTKLGVLKAVKSSEYSLVELMDGYGDGMALLGQIEHNGTTTLSSTFVDLRYNIGRVDERIDLYVDETNNFIGNFSSFAGAAAYVNAYPYKEKFKIRVVSYGGDLVIGGLNNPATVYIDGQVNNLDINCDCRVVAESGYRSVPHVRGTLNANGIGIRIDVEDLIIGNTGGTAGTFYFTDDGVYNFKGLVFQNGSADSQLDLNIEGTKAALVRFEGCTFESGAGLRDVSVASIIARMELLNCHFVGAGADSVVKVFADELVINNCHFESMGLNNAHTGDSVSISGCTFSGKTVASGNAPVLSLSSVTSVIDTRFLDLSVSDTSAITVSVSEDANASLRISQSLFASSSFNASASMFSGPGVVAECLFQSITCGIAPGGTLFSCDEFLDNTIVGSTNEFAVAVRKCERNDGLVVVKSTSSYPLKRVVGNKFLDSTVFGYNVYISDTSDVLISGNIFSSGSGTQDCIFLAAGSAGLQIADNAFNTTGILLNSSVADLKANFSGNIFGAVSTLVSAPGTGGYVQFIGNYFDGNVAYSITGVSKDLVFSDNIMKRGSIVIDGSSVTGLVMSGNMFDDSSAGTSNAAIELRANIDGASICSNVFNGNAFLLNANTVEGLNFSNNMDDVSLQFSVTGTVVMNNCIVSGNRVAFVGIENATLSKFSLVGNYLTGIEMWAAASSGAGDASDIIISGNTFTGGGIVLESAGSLRGVLITGNLGVAAAGVSLQINVTLNDGNISNNSNFIIELTGGAVTSSITGNVALNCDMTFIGNYTSNIISGNFCKNFSISGAVTDLVCNNNFIDGTQTLNISGNSASFSGNAITGDVVVWSSSGSRAASNMQICNNNVGGDFDLCKSSASGTSSFIGGKVQGNIISGDLRILAASGTGGACTFTGNDLSGNSCNAISMSIVSASDTYSDITMNYNSIAEGVLVQVSINPAADFSNFIFSNNTLGDDFELSYSGSSTISFSLYGWLLSGNKLRSFAFLPDAGTGLASSLAIKSASIINNAFSGATATLVGKSYEPGIYVSKGSNTGSVDIENCSFSNNFFAGNTNSSLTIPDLEIKFVNGATGSYKLTNCIIEGNRSLDVKFVNTLSAAMTLLEVSVSNNVFKHTSTNIEGVYMVHSSGASTLTNVHIFGNRGGQIGLFGAGSVQRTVIENNVLDIISSGNGDLTLESTVSGNVMVLNNLCADASITASTGFNIVDLSSNRCSSFALTGGYLHATKFRENNVQGAVFFEASGDVITFVSKGNILTGNMIFSSMPNSTESCSDISIADNEVLDLNLSGFTGSQSVSNMNISHNNIGGTFSLPAEAVFRNGPDQSRFVFNHADTWSAPSSFVLAGLAQGVFPFGNTSTNAATLFSISGAKVLTPADANNVGGSGINDLG
jgi:hypothetical protein